MRSDDAISRAVGIGTTTDTNYFEEVILPTGLTVISLTTSGVHTLALMSDGSVRACGSVTHSAHRTRAHMHAVCNHEPISQILTALSRECGVDAFPSCCDPARTPKASSVRPRGHHTVAVDGIKSWW